MIRGLATINQTIVVAKAICVLHMFLTYLLLWYLGCWYDSVLRSDPQPVRPQQVDDPSDDQCSGQKRPRSLHPGHVQDGSPAYNYQKWVALPYSDINVSCKTDHVFSSVYLMFFSIYLLMFQIAILSSCTICAGLLWRCLQNMVWKLLSPAGSGFWLHTTGWKCQYVSLFIKSYELHNA